MTTTPEHEQGPSQRELYIKALGELPPWKCGRLDMDTYLPEPVQVGRVLSDCVRYVYFDDKEEVVVIGQRADHVAFAASEYRALAAQLAAKDQQIAALVAARKAWCVAAQTLNRNRDDGLDSDAAVAADAACKALGLEVDK